MELNGGYCDLTMIPDLTRFPEVAHAYFLELKYQKSGDTDEEDCYYYKGNNLWRVEEY